MMGLGELEEVCFELTITVDPDISRATAYKFILASRNRALSLAAPSNSGERETAAFFFTLTRAWVESSSTWIRALAIRVTLHQLENEGLRLRSVTGQELLDLQFEIANDKPWKDVLWWFEARLTRR